MQPSSPVEKQPMPTPTRVAVILLALLGVLLLLNSALLWAAQDTAVDQVAKQGADREQSAQQVLLFLLAYGVMGLSALLAAAFLPRRRPWARLVGLLVTSLLATIALVYIVLVTGPSPFNLLLLVTATAAVTSLLSRETKGWVDGVVRTD